MIAKRLMILGLRRQLENLGMLAEALQSKSLLYSADYRFCGASAREIKNNLKKLRKIKRDYFKVDELISLS